MQTTKRFVWDPERLKLRPVPMGAEGNDDPPQGDPPSGAPAGEGNGNSGDEVQSIPQSQLTRMLAREKNQGREAAERALSDELGMPIAEAKALLQAARDREDAEKTEAQKAKDAAEAAKREAQQEKDAAARERHNASVERALIRAGIAPDDQGKLDRVARMVTVEVGASAEDIGDDVKTIREGFPELFAASGEEGTPPRRTPSSDPKGTPPKRQVTEDAYSRGAERAKKLQSDGTVQFEPRRPDNVNA